MRPSGLATASVGDWKPPDVTSVTDVGGSLGKSVSDEWHPVNAAGVESSATKSRLAIRPPWQCARRTPDRRERIGALKEIPTVGIQYSRRCLLYTSPSPRDS